MNQSISSDDKCYIYYVIARSPCCQQNISPRTTLLIKKNAFRAKAKLLSFCGKVLWKLYIFSYVNGHPIWIICLHTTVSNALTSYMNFFHSVFHPKLIITSFYHVVYSLLCLLAGGISAISILPKLPATTSLSAYTELSASQSAATRLYASLSASRIWSVFWYDFTLDACISVQ